MKYIQECQVNILMLYKIEVFLKIVNTYSIQACCQSHFGEDALSILINVYNVAKIANFAKIPAPGPLRVKNEKVAGKLNNVSCMYFALCKV